MPISISGTVVKVVAIIPCFNTQATIAAVIDECNNYVDDVMVIDDGSTDLTAQVAKSAGAIVISHDKNRGKGAAIKTGIRNVDADIILFIDGDGQHRTEDIPNLLDPIIQGKADFVIGSRFLRQSNKMYTPFFRILANYIASFSISFIISLLPPNASFFSRRTLRRQKGIKAQPILIQDAGKVIPNYRIINGRFMWFTDCTSGLRAGKTDICKKINFISNGYQIETEMIYELAKNKISIAEIPCNCSWNNKTSKLSIIKDGFKTIVLLITKTFKYSKTSNYDESENFEIIKNKESTIFK